MLRTLANSLGRIERTLSLLSAVSIVAIMVIVTIDVLMRYFFRNPITGVAELVGMYLMVLLFYAAVSHAFTQDSHIRVDLLMAVSGPTTRRVFEFLVCLVSAPAFLLIAIPTAKSARESYVNDDVLAGLIAWPTWMPLAFVAAGSALLALRLALNAMAHLVALAGGGETVPLPPISSDHGGSAA